MQLFQWEQRQDDEDRTDGVWYARGALRPVLVLRVRGGVL